MQYKHLNQKNNIRYLLLSSVIHLDRELGFKANNRKYIDDISPKNITEIAKFIVPPPDSGIDIVVEKDQGDEYAYDIIQVKYSDLSGADIRDCFATMQRTIKNYLKNPKELSPHLLNLLDNTQFDENSESRITYYVVHKGANTTIVGLNDNEKLIGINDLEDIYKTKGIEIPRVTFDCLKSDSVNNFSQYAENAYLLNVRGYELALLANKYESTDKGRNILFGQNLRDSLSSKSKTYEGMKTTIDKEPEQFWYYNNGITIITEDIDLKAEDGSEIKNDSNANAKVDQIYLSGFSIINGAQTTSALGKYLSSSDNKEVAIEQLKKVYVFARILKVVNADLASKIAVYNNTQNPITTRDMVSNNEEQRVVQDKLLKGDPSIYMETRRGTHTPAYPRILKHRRTSNEELAQLVYAGFLQQPYIAKDKKKSLFNKDYSNDSYVINEFYDRVFKFNKEDSSDNGVLYVKCNSEIDELLLIKHLYKEANRFLKSKNSEKCKELQQMIDKNPNDSEKLEKNIRVTKRSSEISNIVLFYVVTYYYFVKSNISYEYNIDIERFYEDKVFRNKLIEAFCNLYLVKTIRTVDTLSITYSSPATWIRSQKSQQAFLDKISNDINMDFEYEDAVKNFMKNFSKEESKV